MYGLEVFLKRLSITQVYDYFNPVCCSVSLGSTEGKKRGKALKGPGFLFIWSKFGHTHLVDNSSSQFAGRIYLSVKCLHAPTNLNRQQLQDPPRHWC